MYLFLKLLKRLHLVQASFSSQPLFDLFKIYRGVYCGAVAMHKNTDWEMHPDGDETLTLLSGLIHLVFEEADGEACHVAESLEPKIKQISDNFECSFSMAIDLINSFEGESGPLEQKADQVLAYLEAAKTRAAAMEATNADATKASSMKLPPQSEANHQVCVRNK